MFTFLVLCVVGYLIFKLFKKIMQRKNDNVLYVGGILSGKKFTIEDGMVKYRGSYGDKATIPAKHIQSITISPNGFGKSDVIITGNGSELARISKIPSTWAETAMCWLNSKLELI